MKTIRDHPELFKVTCLIDVDAFERLLTDHPNQPFVQSVLAGLREGFWPFADTTLEGYPKTWDGSSRPPKTDKERDFMASQVETEIAAGRFSPSFGADLLPGMYSPPVHAVPKPDSDTLRLVVDHSSGEYNLNSMITREDVSGVHLDGIHTLGASIIRFKDENPSTILIIYKSDVSAAYRQLPMHPLFQILQVITIDGQRYVDRCNNFGDRASQIIWQSFISLVVWILVFKRDLRALKCYVDDAFSIIPDGHVSWYAPFQKCMPTDQVKILHLWDEIKLPHAEKKQISGRIIPILGFQVDPNLMTAYLSTEKRQRLVDSIHLFMQGSSKSLREWLRLAGQLNWAFNVYPWLKPALCAVYAKTAGKSEMWGKVKINNTVRRELTWFVEHVQHSDGIFFLKSMVWRHNDSNHSTLTVHVDASAQGLGIWFLSEKKGYQCRLPVKAPTGAIFFFESLAVCCAIHIAVRFPLVTRLLIATDNTNTFDIFASLSAQPTYNPILMSAIDVLLKHKMDLRVFYIPGPQNIVADALSRYKNDLATTLVTGLQIDTFTPPQDALGAAKK